MNKKDREIYDEGYQLGSKNAYKQGQQDLLREIKRLDINKGRVLYGKFKLLMIKEEQLNEFLKEAKQ